MSGRVVIALGVAAVTAGCSGINYILDNYKGVEKQEITVEDDTYRVFDKPAANRMMITSSLGTAASNGLVKGLTLNAVDPGAPKPRFQNAAAAFLASTGRAHCRITDSYLLVSPQWEVTYDCSPVAAAKPGRARRS